MEVKLNDQEIEILNSLLKQVIIRKGTGELGITHGLNRFVSTNVRYNKKHIATLDQIAKKIGLSSGVNRTDK
jgi:hypothetical protein